MNLILLFILCISRFGGSVTHDGYKTYKIVTKSEAENQLLKPLELNEDYDFWSKINKVGNPVTVMVSPKIQNEFEQFLTLNRINHWIEIQDVESTIKREKEYHQSKQPLKANGISFDQYYRHDEINLYLAQLAEDYPEIVTLKTMGQSYEKRNMNLVHISSNSTLSKPLIFIEAGMHAREWISPAFSLYIINQLVENSDNRNLLEDVDWLILPSMNPDGYEYTWTENRMWRKTRSPGSICNGCDGNRNFGFHWMEAGASDWECNETYAGKEAFSEIETRNLRDILAETPNIKAFISLHSYGQYLFYPYSYADVVPENWEELYKLANQANDAISAVNGTQYIIGSSTEVLYPAAGCSDDWAMGGAGIGIVYVFELPGGGKYGFDLPPSRILPVCIETFEGIKVIANYVAMNFDN